MTTISKRRLNSAGKFLTWILRHEPEAIGVSMDSQGWVSIDELLTKAGNGDKPITLDELKQIVELDEKGRFSISDDGKQVRCNQGHNKRLGVCLDFNKVTPPKVLLHGTAKRKLPLIQDAGGLSKMERTHVHLTACRETAVKVGTRYGEPVIIEIDTEGMIADGFEFVLSDNGVWLTDSVPLKHMKIEK